MFDVIKIRDEMVISSEIALPLSPKGVYVI